MVANACVDAQRVAGEFAATIRDEPSVTQLWLARQEESSELFVVTDGVGMDDELRITAAFGDLVERYPAVELDLWLFDPRRFVSEAAFRAAIPSHASRLKLRD